MKQTSITEMPNDTDEYPEITQADFDRAIFKVQGKNVSKADWKHAVQAKVKKERISITLDPDVLNYFKAKANGKGYQTLINAALREVMLKENFKDELRQVLREELKHA